MKLANSPSGPALRTGSYVFFVSYLAAASIPGDFNHDGNVDSADYVAWRKSDGTQLGYNTWRANVGITSAPTGAEAQLVPEPTTAMLLTTIAFASLLCCRRSKLVGSRC
jgi:hypothetical protein